MCSLPNFEKAKRALAQGASLEQELQEKLPAAARCLIAVSGGKDSVCLLHALCALREEKKLEIAVAHVDHGLREESAEDARWVEEFCNTLGVACVLGKLEQKPAQENLEAWARRNRYIFLEETRQALGFDWILTAHHLGDLRETFLMKMLSGKQPRNILFCSPEQHLLRPFLTCEPERILEYLAQHKLAFREDASNKNNTFFRNAIRNSLMPYLVQLFGKDVQDTINTLALYSALELEQRDEAAAAAAQKLSELGFGSKAQKKAICLATLALKTPQDLDLIGAFLHPMLHYRVSSAKAFEALRVLHNKAQACQFPGGFELRLQAGGFQLRKIE